MRGSESDRLQEEVFTALEKGHVQGADNHSQGHGDTNGGALAHLG